MVEPAQLETDYLVVGAGAMGMAFVDALVRHADVDVVVVERRSAPGGHWLDAYPFVRLHQPSRYYGVDSLDLGDERGDVDDPGAGFTSRASAGEICGYYDAVLARLLASGRVRFFPMSEHAGGSSFRSRLTGAVTEVAVRRAVVDATRLAGHVPATTPPPFAVADGVRCVPVGGLAAIREPPDDYVVIGGGKTATDALGWLLARGVEPDRIRWIRPRDSWQLNRAWFQAGRAKTLAGTVEMLEGMAVERSVDEVYERMEQAGVVLRTDVAVVPTMMRGATISEREIEQLRRVRDVVRMGYVERVEHDRILLTGGEVPTTPGSLHVHCAAPGLGARPTVPVFGDGTVVPQLVTRLSVTLSGALQGYLESTDRSTEEKNRLCRPTGMPSTPFDYLRAILAGIETEMTWFDAPDLQAFLDGSRLNLLAGLGVHDPPEAVEELQLRLVASLGPAFDRLRAFTADATPAERARMFAG
jgi:hypothetical protein